MEAEAEILEPLELPYADLPLLSSSASASASYSPDERARLESLSAGVMRALGPSGPGLISVTCVPRASALRRALLPLARKLALLGNKDRAQLLKEHGLGSDVPLKDPDRVVSSFAMQLKYAEDQSLELPGKLRDKDGLIANENPFTQLTEDFHASEFKHLGGTFKDLGLCMVELGLRLAQVCDKAIGGRELEHSIMDSCTAKGRLIHYHSTLDNNILKETKQCAMGHVQLQKVTTDEPYPFSYFLTTSRYKTLQELGNKSLDDLDEQTLFEQLHMGDGMGKVRSCSISLSNLWQQWHYDYGIFTVLTTPLFVSSCQTGDLSCVTCNQELSLFNEHTYLYLFDSHQNKIHAVKTPPESFIIQVGESADILSRGRLRSTLHAVGRPLELENLSRETFVVFLQPAWGKTLCFSGYLLDTDIGNQEKLLSSNGNSGSGRKEDAPLSSAVGGAEGSHCLMQEILSQIPPLSSRLKEGMTFAEFSRETTKQYYGGSGTQSRR